MSALRFIRLTLTIAYALALLPATLLGSAAYSDYSYRGCPEEAIGQCGDAVTTLQILFGFMVVGGSIVLALWIIERNFAPVKVESDA